MSGPLVIKIGGSTLGSTDTTYADIAAMALAGDLPVVVHGGGAEASKWLEAMGIPSRFEHGLRVTDERVLPVVVAVFAGLVNKSIVAAINGSGARAVGLSGADGRMLECRIADPALGFVGDPMAVHTEAVQALMGAGIVPVISSLGYLRTDGADQIVNVNADTVAGNIAAAVGARSLVFLTDVSGVAGPDGVVSELSADVARAWIADGTVSSGMIPKVEACLHAVALGVPARIIDGRVPGALATAETSGTLVRA